VLLAEVAALTPCVEFPTGAIQYVASGRVCAALLFALVAFLFLAGGDLRRWASERAPQARRTLLWLCVNLCSFGLFFRYTLWLAGEEGGRTPGWVAVPTWSLLAAGATSLLAFFPARLLLSWAWRCRGKALLAGALGSFLAVVTPWAQQLWPQAAGPALAIDRALLAGTYGHAVAGETEGGVPMVGTRHLNLLVTPQCSEVDALAAFWLLAALVVCGRRETVRKIRLALVLLPGTALLYLLIAARIYGLVLVGVCMSPEVCGRLAYSRAGGVCFLVVMVALLSFTLRRERLRAPRMAG
jgi:hypothetical protein